MRSLIPREGRFPLHIAGTSIRKSAESYFPRALPHAAASKIFPHQRLYEDIVPKC